MCTNFQAKQTTFNFIGLNLGKLPNYMRYFGSNNVEGIAKSWNEAEVEAEMNWVEVVARFSNTHLSHSLLHNFILNRTGVNAHFLSL